MSGGGRAAGRPRRGGGSPRDGCAGPARRWALGVLPSASPTARARPASPRTRPRPASARTPRRAGRAPRRRWGRTRRSRSPAARPKCDALRTARTPTMTCPSRQAMVVKGGGSGSGNAKSMVISPPPACMGAVPVPRGRTLQQSGTGSQKYSSSLSPSSRGRSWVSQWKDSCSRRMRFHSIVMTPLCPTMRTGSVR